MLSFIYNYLLTFLEVEAKAALDSVPASANLNTDVDSLISIDSEIDEKEDGEKEKKDEEKEEQFNDNQAAPFDTSTQSCSPLIYKITPSVEIGELPLMPKPHKETPKKTVKVLEKEKESVTDIAPVRLLETMTNIHTQTQTMTRQEVRSSINKSRRQIRRLKRNWATPNKPLPNNQEDHKYLVRRLNQPKPGF